MSIQTGLAMAGLAGSTLTALFYNNYIKEPIASAFIRHKVLINKISKAIRFHQ